MRALLASALIAHGLAACGSPSALPVRKAALTATALPGSSEARVASPAQAPTCMAPALLAARDPSQAMTATALLSALHGQYKLDQIHVYHRAETPSGAYLGAFYGRVINHDDSRSPDILLECNEKAPAAPAFLSAAQVSVPELLHAPSGRITIFDSSSGDFDNPSFNFPSVADVTFDSLGDISYTQALERLGGAPYRTHLYFADALAELPPETRLFRRTDADGFEIRFQHDEIRNDESSAELKASISALVTYRLDSGH